MGNRQWEYLVTMSRDIGNIVVAVLVIGQFVVEKGINPSLFLWGAVISGGAYVLGFTLTYFFAKE